MSLSNVTSGFNVFVNLFQFVRPTVLSLQTQCNEVQEQKPQDVTLQLQSDLSFLEETLQSMRSLIDRAEWRSHEHSVAQLLPDLKDALYDAEDILNEFRWYKLKLALEGNTTELYPVINSFHSAIQRNPNKVTDIKKRLSSLSSQMRKMGFHEVNSQFGKSARTGDDKLEHDVLQLQRDVQCLEDTLPEMYILIDRAEWRIHDHHAADLLSGLKDAVYDAEDLLDEFRWYELKISVEGNMTSVQPVIDFLHSVTQGGSNNVIDIQKRLNNLSSHLHKICLHEATPRFDKTVRPETTLLTESEVFGRDKEMKELIRLLGVPRNNSRVPSGRKRIKTEVHSSADNPVCSALDNNDATIISVPVLSIIGMGGVGKTTLAQNICSHPQVKSHFDLIIWTCVSEDFDIMRLSKEVIEQSSGRAPANDNLNSLQGTLAKSVNNRRLLVVLDDMWDENEQCWKRFCAPFKNVLQGSMILVTTRSQKVADIVSTMEPFLLEGLKDDMFWKFFKLCVFGSDSSSKDFELELIGRQILPKLRGSPLAAKTVGRLLGRSLDPAHWHEILKSELWELRQEETDILPALRLSYTYLPFHLKRCFSFCAVYPKDFEFEKATLANIWVAEGFVEPQGNTPLQHVSCEYFEELVNMSFFQIVRSKYLIPDLMHDMAQFVSKDECFIIKNTSDIEKVPQNVRHLSILSNSDVKCSDLSSLDKHRKLRTLLCDKSLMNMDSVMDHWFNELRFMRVIVLTSVRELQKSISNSKHLRYLKISKAGRLKSLPSEIFCLYNLQRFESSMYQFLQEHGVPVHTSESEGQRKELKLCGYPDESLPGWFHPQNLSNLTSLSLYGCNSLKNISVPGNLQRITPMRHLQF